MGLLHGRLKSLQKENIMQAFKNHELDLLVATTVIEVGVDVPNASLMVIENAERLGLAQLHQLRGRVGRGEQSSHCVLLYQKPLAHFARQRLELLRTSQDGFKIAQADLSMRGPGEVLGTKQAGLANLKIANLVRDEALLPTVAAISQELLTNYPKESTLLLERWLHSGNAIVM